MGFFDFLKKGSVVELKAPISGKVIPIEETPDEAFADKIVGDGIAIDPSGSEILAPCDGKIGKIFKTNHAFSLETKEGLEIFVHFGINTLNLSGKGFERVREEGDEVKAGDVILKIDLNFLKKNAESVITPVVVANAEEVSNIEYHYGEVIAGQDIILTVKK